MQGKEENDDGKGEFDTFLDLEVEISDSQQNHIDMENLHFDVLEATLKSIETRSITPIIKEELKLKIQASRLAAGKEELPTPVFKEPEKYQLTPEEIEKRRIKRERNRIAAEKCRKKKKVEGNNSVQELKMLQSRNDSLHKQVSCLENEIADIKAKFAMAGIQVTPMTQQPQQQTSQTVTSYYHEDASPATCGSTSDVPFQFQYSPPISPHYPPNAPTPSPSPLSPYSACTSDNVTMTTQMTSQMYTSDPYVTPTWPTQLCHAPMPEQEQQHHQQQLPEHQHQQHLNMDAPDAIFSNNCFLELGDSDIPNLGSDNLFVNDEQEAQVPGQGLDLTELPSFY